MLEKKYDAKLVEEGKYQTWLKNDYFKSGDLTKEPFCIVIPPPNVTGKLHLGHAWDTTLQDIIIRYKKMQGFDALWVPGMDHAGIATQAKIDKRLKEMGYKPREMDRNEWLKHAWAWKDEYANTIHEQWAKLGLALDYSKERFTLDEGLNYAVRKVFVDLYNEGLIYRGERIINWDPEAMTALSNEEVIYKDTPGAFYHIKYMIENTNDYLEVATTRPETLFGDTAVAVNPEDERYKHLIGKNVVLPIVNKLIPIIGDEHADMEFGTGVVKITPAHDPNDFEVGERHNLERIVVINKNGTMNENALSYNGMDRFACREKLVNDLKEQGLLIKVEEITHSVGHSERTDVMVEPYLSKQWFVKMDVLAARVLENQEDKDNKINFVPERFEKILNHWMEIARDWCISRQLWWGHQIPAWYKDDEVYVGLEAPEEDGWVQDSDVLDTWFSSALWPFSTLGWPNETEMFKRYFPTSVLSTGYDIIFFWVCRMAFQSLHFTNKRPFKDCIIHGLIRDKQGRKMSKSLGNGVDPMDVIEKYGADALRFFLATSTSPGMDLRYDEEKVAANWNFINKLWNATRFVLTNIDDINVTLNKEDLDLTDKWLLTKYNNTIKEVTRNMEKYEFNNVGSALYSFIWDDFCDNYIEFAKYKLDKPSTKYVLIHVLKGILQMLHPFMPFVTDELYSNLSNTNIILSNYPKYSKEEVYTLEENLIDKVILDITSIRNLKAVNNITKNAFVKFKTSDELYDLFKTSLKINEENIVTEDKLGFEKYSYTSSNIDITYYEEGTKLDINLVKEEIKKLEASIIKRTNLLNNENYVNKAPQNIVELDRVKLKEEKEKLESLKKLI